MILEALDLRVLLKRLCFLLLCTLSILPKLSAIEFIGDAAQRIVPGASKVRINNQNNSIQYVKLAKAENLTLQQLETWLQQLHKTEQASRFLLYDTRRDKNGFTHYKFQQYHGAYKVEHAVFYIHTKNGQVLSANGDFRPNISGTFTPSISAKEALQLAKNTLKSKKYVSEKEDIIQPPELTIFNTSENSRLSYKCDIYSLEPLARKWIYIDAQTGDVLEQFDRIHHIAPPQDSVGIAETKYSGTKTITTDYHEGIFRLREYGRGNGIITLDMNRSLSMNHATDFIDLDNYWNTTSNQDNAAYDAHFGAELTYDYFFNLYGLNSYDNQGAILRNHVHFYGGPLAFWSGSGFYYGDGNSHSISPLTSAEIVGHEITHAVTEYSANLVYLHEYGALNESFSDIFGIIIDFQANPESANYILGDQITTIPFFHRNMANPNALGDPDTYHGLYWWWSHEDNFGVHSNSGVQNYWFYLLSEGGAGTNDNGDDFSVDSIGMEAAGAIAFRNLTVYLTPYSNYSDARYYAIEAAIDLFGECSPEVINTTNAWYAVGLGEPFSRDVVASAIANPNNSCTVPATVHFTNTSLNGAMFHWDFGDGTTSTLEDPIHNYTTEGVYTVSLIVNGQGDCSSTDTLILPDFITVTNGNGPVSPNCIPEFGDANGPQGIFDVSFSNIQQSSSGVENTAYSDYSCTQEAIVTEGQFYTATVETYWNELISIWIDLNNDGQFNTTNELVYTAPEPSSIHQIELLIPTTPFYETPLRMRIKSSKNSTYLIDPCTSYQMGECEDYALRINENFNPPISNFQTPDTIINVEDAVHFTDISEHLPTSWYWEFDGATPSTSTEQHPTVIYENVGTYNVRLVTTNAFGSDTLIREQYITVSDTYDLCASNSSSLQSGTLQLSGLSLCPEGDSLRCSFLIHPDCALEITLTIQSWNVAYNYDYLLVYDGVDQTGELLLSSVSDPNPPSVTATSGAMYIVFLAEEYYYSEGWEASWETVTPASPPIADFTISSINPPINTPVQFTDQSTIFPHFWTWDFGDGNSSSEQNPTHIYTTPGTYTVQLIVDNCFAQDTISSPITVQEAPQANITPVQIIETIECGAVEEVELTLHNSGMGALQFDTEILNGPYDSTSIKSYDALSSRSTFHLFSPFDVAQDSFFFEVTLNGDFPCLNTYECDKHYASLFINGTFIDSLRHDSITSSTIVVSRYNFSSEQISAWLQEGGILVEIENSYYIDMSNNANETLANTHTVRLVEVASDWLSIEQEADLISPNDSTIISLQIDATNLAFGTYSRTIHILTNDPLSPHIILPITVDVIGVPEINISSNCIDFGSIMQHTSISQELIITNSGCAVLEIDTFLINQPEFMLSSNQFSIEPWSTDTLTLTFTSDIPGYFNDTIFIEDNVTGLASFCVFGSVFGAPAIEVEPNTIEVFLESCIDSATIPITISNTAYDSLELLLAHENPGEWLSSLDSVLARLNRSFETITSLVPNRYDFTEGITGFNIANGGNTMYYGGNYLSVDDSINLIYSDNQIISSAELGSNGKYFTKKHPGLFVFAANLNDVDTFRISGITGSLSGTLDELVLNQTFGNITFQGFVKRVFGDDSPSVNHLIIVRSGDFSINHSYGPYPELDNHSVHGLSQVDRIYYLLFSSENGGYISDAKMLEIMNTFIKEVEPSELIRVPNGQYDLGAGELITLELDFTTTFVEGGQYQDFLPIYSNDPLNPILEIPISINVSDELCANFEFTQTLDCSRAVQFYSTTVNIPDSYLWDFGDGNTSTEINPLHFYELPGIYDVTLSVSNGSSTSQILWTVDLSDSYGPIPACEVNALTIAPFYNISKFVLNTINNDSGTESEGYSDFTCDFATELKVGIPYTIEIQGSNSGVETARAWIDFNNDGNFTINELIFEELNTYSPHTGTIVLPMDVITDEPLRMRIVCEDSLWPVPEACSNVFDGEFEDYTVILKPNGAPPAANFEATIIDACAGVVNFTDLSVNSPAEWLWDFGDGTTSTEQNPMHTFELGGLYEIMLTVSNPSGSTTLSQTIEINAIGAAIDLGNEPVLNEPINFIAISPGAETFFWNFGDGTTSSGQSVEHTFTAAGVYFVRLTVTNTSNCVNQIFITINISTTAVQEIVSNLSIYPNPTTGKLIIDYDQSIQLEQLEVHNITGKQVYLQKNMINQTPYQLNLSMLPSGIYLLKLHFRNGHIVTEKLVIH